MPAARGSRQSAMSPSEVAPQNPETPSGPSADAPAPAASRGARRGWALLAVFLAIVGADQLTKGLAVSRLTSAFDHYGARSLAERAAGLYSFENLDNEPYEEGKRDLRRRAVVVVPGFWNHRYVENPGAAWGLLADVDARWRVPFFHVVSLTALAFILLFFRRLESDQRLLSFALSLVLGGAVGNYIDRFARNYVIDFIDWHWRGRHFPTFNVADAAITVGVALMLLDAILQQRRERAAARLAAHEQPGAEGPARSETAEAGPQPSTSESESN